LTKRNSAIARGNRFVNQKLQASRINRFTHQLRQYLVARGSTSEPD
jgi:hypothetical protein